MIKNKRTSLRAIPQVSQFCRLDCCHSVCVHPEVEGIDISGLGATAGQVTPYKVPVWERAGTDKMCLVHRRVVIGGGDNRPCLDGTEVNALEHAEAIVAGFTEMYNLLLKYRSDLLADDGPVSRFYR